MSTIQLKFFARLREDLGTSELAIPAEQAPTLDALVDWLVREYPRWREPLDGPLLRAVNQEMVNGDAPLRAGDEVALFPPVTGG